MGPAARPLAVLAVLLVLDLVLLFPGGGSDAPGADSRPPRARVGLVFDVGGRGDRSFNDSAFAGLERARRELGVDVEYVEPSGAEDRESALRLFAARGFDLVVGVGFIFSTDLVVVAREHPDVRFAGVDFAPPADGRIPPNLVGLKFREEEGSFLVGAAAALLSRTRHVGFVGGMDVPLIHKFEAGFRTGVRAVCDACRVSVAYAGVTPEAFKDPARGKELALAQIARGADVLFHASGSTGLGVFEAARQARVFAIGVDSDQHDDMPGVVVTSMLKRVDVVLVETVRAVLEGRFRGGIRTFGLRERGIDWVHQGPHARRIPRAVAARVSELGRRIASGALVVPSSREALPRSMGGEAPR
ncbi:MAG: BMP family ABC transporter substrate-binding protein [Deltaproteobacteria bacterium]|nr:BMP family ABC transporter substrate-binding protein [Deltaproteobacteria bacterium]